MSELVNAFFSQEFLDACKTGNVGVVLELLECGADPNQADKVRGILSLQCQYVRWLMILSLQDVPLHWAINNGHDEIVRVLLAAKATVNTQTKVLLYKHVSRNMLFTLFSSYVQSGVTPLWEASFNGHQKRMELLIDAGANVDVPREVSVSSCTHISEATSHRASPCSVDLVH